MEPALSLLDPDPAGRPALAFLVLRGDVDACDRAALEGMRLRLRGAAAVHVDVGELGFCGTTFLRSVADLGQQAWATGATLQLRRVPRHLVRLLALAGMEAHFEPHAERGTTTLRLRPRTRAPSASTRP